MPSLHVHALYRVRVCLTARPVDAPSAARYVLNGEIKDVSEALCVLLTQHIEPRVDKHALCPSNLHHP
jgi:hypothetical protein